MTIPGRTKLETDTLAALVAYGMGHHPTYFIRNVLAGDFHWRGLSAADVRRVLRRLAARGLVEQVGDAPKGNNFLWRFIAPEDTPAPPGP